MGKKSQMATHKEEYDQLKELFRFKLTDSKEDIEVFAKILHEAGREAVLNNKVVKMDGNPIGQIKFKEWNEITEDAREGRRIQARYLSKKGIYIIKQ